MLKWYYSTLTNQIAINTLQSDRFYAFFGSGD